MSKIDAERDGIKWSYGAGRGSKTGAVIYHVPCDNCGRIHNRKTYTGNSTYWCDICKNLSQRSKKIKKEMETFEDKYDKRFSEAIKRLPKNKSYTEAISICEKCRTKFSSIPEAMLAIALIEDGYRIIPQQKILKYRVDFAIPDERIIIEVDGSIYHTDKKKELEREAAINYAIGLDWKIIHIPADYITKNINKVLKYIKRISTQGTE